VRLRTLYAAVLGLFLVDAASAQSTQYVSATYGIGSTQFTFETGERPAETSDLRIEFISTGQLELRGYFDSLGHSLNQLEYGYALFGAEARYAVNTPRVAGAGLITPILVGGVELGNFTLETQESLPISQGFGLVGVQLTGPQRSRGRPSTWLLAIGLQDDTRIIGNTISTETLATALLESRTRFSPENALLINGRAMVNSDVTTLTGETGLEREFGDFSLQVTVGGEFSEDGQDSNEVGMLRIGLVSALNY
jgi:hypothetical protein